MEKLLLPAEVFTALPRSGDAKLLHVAYREKLKISFSSLVTSAEKGFNQKFPRLREKIENLDIKRRFSPCVYFLHHQIQNEMRASNAVMVREFLSKLEQAECYADHFSIRYGMREDWEIFLAQEVEKIKARNFRGQLPKVCLEFKTSTGRIESSVYQTLQLIQKYDPTMSEQIEEYISTLVLFEGEGVVGMTDVRAYGAIFLRIPEKGLDPISHFAEHIIHETSHLHLNALMAQDPIILNDPNQLFGAPIRLDKRPMFGVFHATFVLSRIVRFFRRLVEMEPHHLHFRKTLDITSSQFQNGLNTVRLHAQCTPMGQQILHSFEEMA